MSLNNWTFSQVIWKQVKWKSGAFSQSLITLITIQLVLHLLTWNGSSSSGGGFNHFHVYIHYYSLDMMVIVTCMWVFITSLLMQSKVQQQDDFSVVTNRFATNISNSIVVIIFSFIATIISIATLYISVMIIQLFTGNEIIKDEMIVHPIHMIIIFSIILLVASCGFLMGSAFNVSKLLGIGIIVLFFVFVSRLPQQLASIFIFLFEGGDFAFILKAVIGSVIIFLLSIWMLSRKEVFRR